MIQGIENQGQGLELRYKDRNVIGLSSVLDWRQFF